VFLKLDQTEQSTSSRLNRRKTNINKNTIIIE